MVKANVSRKGITPVIAIVLLLMMTVAAAGLAYEFIMNMSEKQTEAIGEQVSAQSDKMRTELRVLQIQNGSNQDNFTFFVKNTGSMNLNPIDKKSMELKVDGKMLIDLDSDVDVTGSCFEEDQIIDVGETCNMIIEHVDMNYPDLDKTKTFEFILDSGYVFVYSCNRVSADDYFC